jgi:hypothetical protein
MTSSPTLRSPAHTWWPLVAAFIAAAAVFAWVVVSSLAHSDGRLVYALDDPYIHMAIARTLATDGTWGIEPGHFVSASSSLLCTVLLAGGDLLFGVREIAPFVMNVAACGLLIGLVFVLARRRALPPMASGLLLVAVILLTPLATLAMDGLEHVLQAALDLAFLACAVEVLTAEERRERAPVAVFALAPLVTSVRYEGAFLIAIVAGLLVLRRRWRDAVIVTVCGALPLVAFGAYSISHGGFFLPNSVVLKGQALGGIPNSLTLSALFGAMKRTPLGLVSRPHLLVMFLASSAVMMRELRAGKPWTPAVIWNVLFLVAGLIHLQLAATGSFYRYEAYLVVIGLVALGLTGWPADAGRRVSNWPLWAASTVAAGVFFAPLAWRAAQATADTPTAVGNIYQQQYQMGLFVREYYAGQTVAVNDLGAVAFLSRSHVVDLVGLGDNDVARARRAGRRTTAFLDQHTRRLGVKAAIIYTEWFAAGVPPGWRKVADWTIPDRVSADRETVAIFAASADEEERLLASVRAFAVRLPPAVIQRVVGDGPAEPGIR